MSINKVLLIGRLGQDPELKYTPSGSAVCSFSLATSDTWTDKNGQKQERTEWHRVVVWGNLAELCNQYLAKGRQVFVDGSLQTRQWEDKQGQKRYTTEINAKNVQFLGNSPSAGKIPLESESDDSCMTPEEGQHISEKFSMENNARFTADDIPF